jgi:hypothetical protein
MALKHDTMFCAGCMRCECGELLAHEVVINQRERVKALESALREIAACRNGAQWDTAGMARLALKATK